MVILHGLHEIVKSYRPSQKSPTTKNQNLSIPLRLSDFKWNMLPICLHPSIHSGAIFARTAALKARWRWRNDTIIGNYANPSQSATTCCCWSTFFRKMDHFLVRIADHFTRQNFMGKNSDGSGNCTFWAGELFLFLCPPPPLRGVSWSYRNHISVICLEQMNATLFKDCIRKVSFAFDLPPPPQWEWKRQGNYDLFHRNLCLLLHSGIAQFFFAVSPLSNRR